jgi:hypothetical protein
MHANMARAHLLDSAPSDVTEFCQLQNGCFREALLEVLRLVYTDQVLPAAKAIVDGAWQHVRPADKQVWAQFLQHWRQECSAFVTAKTIEQATVEGRPDERLRTSLAISLLAPTRRI